MINIELVREGLEDVLGRSIATRVEDNGSLHVFSDEDGDICYSLAKDLVLYKSCPLTREEADILLEWGVSGYPVCDSM